MTGSENGVRHRTVSQKAKATLSRTRNLVYTGLCRRLLRSLPQTQVASFRESINLVDYLDYPDARIVMATPTQKQRRRLRSCAKEPETVAWIKEFINPGDVFYDVGANVGAYSFVAWAATDGDCTIYAFEPSFATFAALSENVMLNQCQGKVMPLHIALSDETALITFNYSQIMAGAARHSMSDSSNASHDTDNQGTDAAPEATRSTGFSQPIFAYRLDELIAEFGIRPPNHLKIDVDGAELRVIRGAEKTLADPNLKSILIEIDKESESDLEVIRLISENGFSVSSRHTRGKKFDNVVFAR